MFPMLGPPRPKKKDQKYKTVRLLDPKPSPPTQSYNQPSSSSTFQPSLSSSASHRAIYEATILGDDDHRPRPSENSNDRKLNRPPSSPSAPLRRTSPSTSSLPSVNPPKILPKTLIVISFITRFPSKKNQGQGSEILFYKPKTGFNSSESHYATSCTLKCGLKNSHAIGSKWSFLFLDGGPMDELTSDQLSIRSIKRHLIPPDDRLIRVRSSKQLRWDRDTVLVSVLYRLQEIDRKKDEEWIKMNVESHYWTKIAGFHSAIENELVSTALAAVCLPIAFNIGFEEIKQQERHTRSDFVTLKALETLYLSVQAGYARDGFRFYPQSAEPLKKAGNPDRDFKRRIWAYWTEVLCWHLIGCRSIDKVSIAYALNKIVAVLKPSVRNEKVNVEDLEKLMVQAIGAEADRCRQSVDNIVKHTAFELIHASDHLNSKTDPRPLHLFTLGSSSATFGALSQLVKHFITQSRWNLKLNHEKVMERVKITIAECRPLHEGVILATKLNDLIKLHEQPPSRPPDLNSKKSIQRLPSFASFDTMFETKDWYLDATHQKFLDRFEDYHAHLESSFAQPTQVDSDQPQTNLGDLFKQDKKDQAQQGTPIEPLKNKLKVTIELTTDVGLRSCILDASNHPNGGILILSADRVLPNGDAICKMGSASAAYTAHFSNQMVIILVRHDRIEPGYQTNPYSSFEETNEKGVGAHPLLASSMILSWKSLFKKEIIDELIKKVHIGTKTDDLLINHGFEIVKSDWISFFISDSGKMNLDRIIDVSNTLTSLHELLWEDNGPSDFIPTENEDKKINK